MPSKKSEPLEQEPLGRHPATSDAEYEKQMIYHANELAKKQILAGTASSQVITHFLKQGSSRDALEQEKLRNENLKMEQQIEQLKSQQRAEDMLQDVLKAIKTYGGSDDDV